jgi:MFS family permease
LEKGTKWKSNFYDGYEIASSFENFIFSNFHIFSYFPRKNAICTQHTQYDLVCEKDIYPTLGLVALNVGGPIGVYLFGVLNDRYGRRFSYFSCLATLLFGSFITAFSRDFGMWAFSRIIVGLTIPAVYQIPFIIGEFAKKSFFGI